ncbi:hypothetical protein HDV00_001088 [Rhizophlyctis rosea]|nr:hypothetical protein HDV00_001088 [Rhizophlyctis rosea]
MKFATLAVAALTFVSSVAAQSGAWQQCGGNNFSGSKTCVSGYTCSFINEWYSQCVPGSSQPTTTIRAVSTTRTTTTTRAVPTTTVPTTTRSSTTVTRTTTSTVSAPAPSGTGVQIRAVQDPVFHLYLQNSGGKAVLGSESTGGRYIIANGKIQTVGSGLYLNYENTTNGYKALTFDATSTSTGWGLEGDTIITTNGSPLGRQLNFLVCGSQNVLYLATNNDKPSANMMQVVGEVCILEQSNGVQMIPLAEIVEDILILVWKVLKN